MTSGAVWAHWWRFRSIRKGSLDGNRVRGYQSLPVAVTNETHAKI